MVVGAMLAIPTFASKPANLPGAQKIDWNLSGAVMPAPPYGSLDIPSSDILSKLIVNQPNGNTQTTVTGVMNGLSPNTTYTVYFSNGYTPATFTGWDVTGSYTINVEYLGVDYPEDLVLVQSGSSITGSLELSSGGSVWIIDSGSLIGDTVSLHAYFQSNPAMEAEFVGSISGVGSMSGTWKDLVPGTRDGAWNTTGGNAAKNYSGSTGWPGLLAGQSPFTFVTDQDGSGSWHVNLKKADLAPGVNFLSVWINGSGATILISDQFSVLN